MENQMTSWDYDVFAEGWGVHKDLKSKHRLTILKCELAEEGYNEVALCSFKSVAKEQSYHCLPTDELSFYFYEVLVMYILISIFIPHFY